MLQNKEWWVHASMINYWKAHKPVHFVHSCVLSITQQYKLRTTWEALLQSIQPIQKIWKIHSWNMHPISRCMNAITPRFQQCGIRFIALQLWEVFLRYLCLTLKPLHANRKSSPMHGCALWLCKCFSVSCYFPCVRSTSMSFIMFVKCVWSLAWFFSK